MQPQQLAAHLHAQLRIEVGQRFVQQQHLGLDGERARERDSLLLPAGKLVRPARAVAGESHELERGIRAAPYFLARQPALLESESHVPRHRHVRPEGVVLEHHADIALPRLDAGHVAPADEELACLVLVEAGDQAQQRRLARARGPQEREELPRLHSERDVVQDFGGPIRQLDILRLDADLLHLGYPPWPSVDLLYRLCPLC